MCERYVLPKQEDAEREFVPAQCWWKFAPSFNVSFPQYVPVMRRHEGAVEGVMMRWGFVPRIRRGGSAPERAARSAFGMARQTPDTRDPWLSVSAALCRWPASTAGSSRKRNIASPIS